MECTIDTGDIVPIYFDEVLPGDTVKLRTNSLVRMLTPINPVMDNAWMDIYFFFVPRRLTWEHWEEFMGENKTDAWTQTTEYTIPQLNAPEGGWDHKSIAHYLGARMGTSNISIDAQYVRSYVLIFNEWFRNQNVTEPAEMSKGDSDTTGNNGDNYVTDLQKGGHFAKAVKYADYFTRCLPEPQKGPDVLIPLGTSAPVDTGIDHTVNNNALRWINQDGTELTSSSQYNLKVKGYSGGTFTAGYSETQTEGQIGIKPENLWADLENAAGATINQLRQAFAIQRMYEIDATSGSRYIEIIAGHFGVNSPDARLQRPEYLGGKRIPINMTDIVQTSATDLVTPQGNTAGMSKTIDSHDCFTKSFVEHGILLGLAVIRTEHTYQQGIPKILLRKTRTDFYWPELANIGEVGVTNEQLYAQGTTADKEIFGYQEAWAEYRYPVNNRICGELNSDYTTPLDTWHYGDDYERLPTLSDTWIRETKNNVARTLAIQNQAQFKADFYFDQTWTREMPIYSVPSLTGWN